MKPYLYVLFGVLLFSVGQMVGTNSSPSKNDTPTVDNIIKKKYDELRSVNPEAAVEYGKTIHRVIYGESSSDPVPVLKAVQTP